MMKLGRSISLSLLMASLGCADSTAPPVVTLQTDSQAYTLTAGPASYQVTIGLQLTNVSGGDVFIANCNGDFPAHLEKLVADDWVVAWTGVWNLCASPAIVVKPGGQYQALLHISAGYPSNNVYAKWGTPDIPGQYRVVAETLAGSSGALALEQRTSNTFTISTGTL